MIPTTIGELIELYLEDREGLVHEKTMFAYRHYLDDFRREHGGIPLSELRPSIVRAWVKSKPRWKSTSTKRTAMKYLLQACNFGVYEGFFELSPLARLGKELRNVKDARREFLILPEHEERFLAVAHPAIATMFQFLLGTGRRPMELARAKRSEVHDANGRLHLKIRDHKNFSYTGRSEDVHVPDGLQDRLRELRDDPENGTPYLFLNSYGNRWRNDAISRNFWRLVRRAGLPEGMVAYSCRHTFITRKLLSGCPLPLVAKLVGNSVAVLCRHYEHCEQAGHDIFTTAVNSSGQPTEKSGPTIPPIIPADWQFDAKGFRYRGERYELGTSAMELLRLFVTEGKPLRSVDVSKSLGLTTEQARNRIMHFERRITQRFPAIGEWRAIIHTRPRDRQVAYALNFPPPAASAASGGPSSA